MAPESRGSFSQGKRPCRTVCGSCSHLCQVAQVSRQAGASLSSSFQNPKAHSLNCLRILKALCYFILVSPVRNNLTLALLRVIFLNIVFHRLSGASLNLEKVPTSQAIRAPRSWDPRVFLIRLQPSISLKFPLKVAWTASHLGFLLVGP